LHFVHIRIYQLNISYTLVRCMSYPILHLIALLMAELSALLKILPSN